MAVIDWSHCPIVEIDPKKLGGVPTVRAWRVAADSLVANYDDGLSAEEIADVFELPLSDVQAILAYAEKHRLAHSVR